MAKSSAPVYEQPKAPEFSVAEQRALTQAQLAKPGEAPGRPQDPMYQQRAATMYRRLQHTGTQPATIVNFLPVRLAVNSSLPALQHPIPACELEDDYRTYTWDEPIIEAIMSEGVRTPIDYVPRQMAEEFLREYTTEGGPGGVMIFDGTAQQFEEAMRSDPKTQARAREVVEQAVKWMMFRFQQAQNWWNTPQHQMAANIGQQHRDCASRLRRIGRLGDHDPEWMDVNQTQMVVQQKCPICTRYSEPGQIACANCAYTFDVAEAFRQKIIDENSGLLERLTREQVEELGVSAYVAETADEYPERLKRGDPKPLSVAAQRQYDAHQKLEAERARKNAEGTKPTESKTPQI
jgi:hypothetical protein